MSKRRSPVRRLRPATKSPATRAPARRRGPDFSAPSGAKRIGGGTPIEQVRSLLAGGTPLGEAEVASAGDGALLVRAAGLRFAVFDWDQPGLDPARVALAAGGDAAAPLGILALVEKPDERTLQAFLSGLHFDFVTKPVDGASLANAMVRLARLLSIEREFDESQKELGANQARLKELQDIGIALSAEHDLDRLLQMIVERARQITGADAGSLYIVEEGEPGPADAPREKRLRFKVAQNDSVDAPFTEFTMPLSTGSIAGFAAVRGEELVLNDVYVLADDLPYRFNRSFDEKFGYRSKSMLVVPMKNRSGEVIGVVQLINRKRDRTVHLTASNAEREVLTFTGGQLELVGSLASQAAVCLENAKLYDEIQTLFDGFVRASVSAVESRDPTTAGHSLRVSKLTVRLAEIVDREESGPFAPVKFSRDEYKEMEYAAVLHDFGKIGVREQVLVKAKKLYPWDYELIVRRFAFARKSLEADYGREKVDLALARGPEAAGEISVLDARMRQEIEDLERWMEVIRLSNEPTVLPEGQFERLQQLLKVNFTDHDGETRSLLTPSEVFNLSIPKGSLNENERKEIESHALHTYEYLKKIPWSKRYRRIPEIAGKHHEKLDGKGYPFHSGAHEIPVQTRMMTISDIFDALTASDRPYKRAVPLEKALDIISFEAKAGQVDAPLFELFLRARVFEVVKA